MSKETMVELSRAIDERRGRYDRIAKAWTGNSPAAFMSKKSREALDDRLRRLSVNYPRLVVNSKVDRLSVSGFVSRETGESDPNVWSAWERAGLVSKSEKIHTDYYLYGAAYATVWATMSGRPAVTTGTPLSTCVLTDPASGEVQAALRRLRVKNGTKAILFEPDQVSVFTSTSPDFIAGPGGWLTESVTDNPFGIVPVVPFIREQSSEDVEGTSAVEDILDLTDAQAKILADAMVTSEHFARPRRWATGLEIEEDEDGNVVDPFRKESHLQSESPDTKFGQFNTADMSGYESLIATITQQIGSLTGLPPHYLGLHGDQPANADGVRAAEAQLASAAYSDQRQLNSPWSRVAQLLSAVGNDSIDPTESNWKPVYSSPEIRTPAQAADAALKQRDIGIPLETVLVETLGYAPDHAKEIAQQADRANIAAAAGSLGRLQP